MPGVATSRQPKGVGFALRDALPWKALSGIVRAAEPAGYAAVFLPEISGRDALVTLGMLAGVFGYAEFTPGIDAWIKDTAQGAMTLPSLTGIGAGWWTLAFVAFLAFAGWGMGRLEARFAGLKPRAA